MHLICGDRYRIALSLGISLGIINEGMNRQKYKCNTIYAIRIINK
jgi:hypothetical protein